ncbi:caib/baif family protein-like protein [Dipodascopsis uninucleata]
MRVLLRGNRTVITGCQKHVRSIWNQNPSRQWLQERRMTSSHPNIALPLTGVKIVDLTRVLAGPYATQILADLGAEVVKIEHPIRGDDTRSWGPPFAKAESRPDHPGESAYYLSVIYRNKKSIGLNFKEEKGREILKKLIAGSDVVIENYLPGALAKYGLSYEQIGDDRIIYASITGYGQTGPYRNRAGYDVMVEAEMGLMHITGEPDRPPVKVGVAVTDLTTGLYAASSILAALYAREQTGLGQYIDIALSDCQVATLSNIASSCLISGEPDAGRQGTSHPSICPYQAFPTKDGSVMIGGANDRLFGVLCSLIKKEELATDERFKTNALRVKHRSILVPMIIEETQKRTTQDWLDIFDGSGLAYAAVNDVQTTLNHPQIKARDMITTFEHPTCGSMKFVSPPVKYSKAKPSVRSAPPALGEHTDSILHDLGYSTKDIDGMRLSGVIG